METLAVHGSVFKMPSMNTLTVQRRSSTWRSHKSNNSLGVHANTSSLWAKHYSIDEHINSSRMFFDYSQSMAKIFKPSMNTLIVQRFSLTWPLHKSNTSLGVHANTSSSRTKFQHTNVNSPTVQWCLSTWLLHKSNFTSNPWKHLQSMDKTSCVIDEHTNSSRMFFDLTVTHVERFASCQREHWQPMVKISIRHLLAN
jgi:hypothetical protein